MKKFRLPQIGRNIKPTLSPEQIGYYEKRRKQYYHHEADKDMFFYLDIIAESLHLKVKDIDQYVEYFHNISEADLISAAIASSRWIYELPRKPEKFIKNPQRAKQDFENAQNKFIMQCKIYGIKHKKIDFDTRVIQFFEDQLKIQKDITYDALISDCNTGITRAEQLIKILDLMVNSYDDERRNIHRFNPS